MPTPGGLGERAERDPYDQPGSAQVPSGGPAAFRGVVCRCSLHGKSLQCAAGKAVLGPREDNSPSDADTVAANETAPVSQSEGTKPEGSKKYIVSCNTKNETS